MTNNLPGPGLIIGLMVAAILAVWLGLFGSLDVATIFNRVAGYADQLQLRSIVISFVVAIGIILFGLLLGRLAFGRPADNAGVDPKALPEANPLLSKGD